MIIKRYNEFINEGRSEVLYSDLSAVDLIEEMVPWFIFGMNGKEIYRGIESKEGYLIIDPSKHTRSPRGEVQFDGGVPTYYNNILIESERWSKYSDIPRNKSIFCTNDIHRTEMYGENVGGSTYLVIPFEKDTEFIMAQDSDLYASFKYMENRFGLHMPSFLMKLRKIFKLQELDYDNLSTLRKVIDTASKKEVLNENGDKTTNLNLLINFVNKISLRTGKKEDGILRREEIEKYGGVTGWLEMLLDPDLNQFMRVKYNKDINFDVPDMYIESRINRSHELWTNKKCLLIRSDLLD